VEIEGRKKREVVGARSAVCQDDEGSARLRDEDDLGDTDPRFRRCTGDLTASWRSRPLGTVQQAAVRVRIVTLA